jgi:phosphate transport system substrate-binding protein
VFDAAAQDRVVVVGSGSSISARLYATWTHAFSAENPAIQVHYLPVGASEGIQQISLGVSDFGGGELPLGDQPVHGSSATLVAIPTALVALVPIYNLRGHPDLNFSGDVLANIYLGNIRNWRDSRIAKLNPSIDLPDQPITVVYRARGKGSNYIFTDFLSKTNIQFRTRVGTSPSPHWPLGMEAQTEHDMVKKVAATLGAIGYVELGLARSSDIAYGRVQNESGHFVEATPASTEAACVAMDQTLHGVLDQSITNAPGMNSYPIASFTWIYTPAASASPARWNALKQFLSWSLQEGQHTVADMGYTPLPDRVAAQALARVHSLP